ncbi:MAG: M1 family peptidase, partial [Gelidibacter sp.]|nr:M1 family peptidase [Gelidibacter sp.]
MKFGCFFLCFIIGFAVFGQQTESVDFERISADIQLKPSIKEVKLYVKYEFKILKDVDSVYLDFGTVYHYEIHNQNFKGFVKDQNNKLIFYNNEGGFKANQKYEFELVWFDYPKKALYFIDWNHDGKKQIWTQGQGKYTSNWLPSIDDMNDKIEFDQTITFDKNYEVIANGKLVDVIENDSTKTWQFNMNKPMSSYLVALAIGKYNKKTELSKSGIPLVYYYYPEDVSKVEPTYRYTKQIFDFLEDEIGVPYPWEIYKQVPVKDFLYSGMENTSLTIFSDALMTDSTAFVDKNYVNVNAHELAHQWFGDLVT